jgi:hypothetical protein
VTDELTPDQEESIRRLLAEARHDGPVPPDVAARLDGVLDELVSTGVDDLDVFGSGTAGSVTAIAGVRRRRRNAGRLLLAAAAVVVAGVAVGQVIGDTDFGAGADSADAGSASAPRETAVEGEAADDNAPEAAPDAGGSGSGDGSLLADLSRSPIPLSSANFAADVRNGLRLTARDRRTAAYADFDGLGATATASSTFECATGDYGAGAKLPAYYDAEEAVLVLRRPRSGMQRVDLLTCGTAVELNSVTLPAP